MDWVYAQMFVRNSVFCTVRFTYTLSQPSTSVRNATNLCTFCFRDYLCPWRDSSPCDALSLDHNILSNLYFYRQVQKSDRINSDRQSGSDKLGSTRTNSDRIKK